MTLAQKDPKVCRDPKVHMITLLLIYWLKTLFKKQPCAWKFKPYVPLTIETFRTGKKSEILKKLKTLLERATQLLCMVRLDWLNCFIIIFRWKHQKVQNNELKLDKQYTKNMTQLSGSALKCHIYRERDECNLKIILIWIFLEISFLFSFFYYRISRRERTGWSKRREW